MFGAGEYEASIVFARTKHGSERLMKHLSRAGFATDSVHGNKSQGQRQRAIDALRSGSIKVLVATDVAARGLDIPVVRFVYNYDLPNVPENYVHRIGRTARAGKDGKAIALVASDEMGLLKDVEKVLKTEIPTASGRRWDTGFGDGPTPKPRRRRKGPQGPKSHGPKPEGPKAQGPKPHAPKPKGKGGQAKAAKNPAKQTGGWDPTQNDMALNAPKAKAKPSKPKSGPKPGPKPGKGKPRHKPGKPAQGGIQGGKGPPRRRG